jgi:hypothetical protein
MSNRVKFNDIVSVQIFDADEPSIDISKDKPMKKNNIYELMSKYLLIILLLFFLIYLLF